MHMLVANWLSGAFSDAYSDAIFNAIESQPWVTVQSTSEMASKMASEMGQRRYLVASLYCMRSSVKRENFKVVMQQNRTFV